MTYRRRLVDDLLDEVLDDLAAIAIEGAKGVGKTATASQRAATTIALDDPAQRAALASGADLLALSRKPILVDEWQLQPEVWDRIRRAVDVDGTGGQFLLTGSATAQAGVRLHSGAGRIVRLEMRPLSYLERSGRVPVVSLGALLTGASAEITGTADATIETYTDEILRSGFPGIRDLSARARTLQLDSYLARIVDRDLPGSGVSVRRPAALTAWLTAYAAATATNASYSTILDAATPGEGDKPARQTVAGYREQLLRLFVLDPLPAWTPALSPLKRLTLTPKHHLVDPALAARLVGLDREALLRGEGVRESSTGTWLGALFESLVTQSVRVYTAAIDARVGHLRTKDSEREVDLIVEASDRTCLAIEVKLADTVSDADVAHLHWLEGQIGSRLADKVVVYTGSFAYRRPDGVAVVPLALLGP